MMSSRASAPVSGALDFPIKKFITNRKAPYGHNNYLARKLDALGRLLSLRREGPWKWTAENVLNKVLVIGSAFTLGIVGGLCRAAASIAKNVKIVAPPPTTDTLTSSQSTVDVPEQKEFSLGIYTLNTGLMTRLPYAKKSFINEHLLGENRQRAADIADDILLFKPDIVQLQEVFDEAAEDVVRNKLKDDYPYCVHGIGNSLLTVGSGLSFFSKYPIVDIQFLPYDHSMLGEETLATKGALLAVLEIDGKKVLSVGTHTQSGGGIIKALSERWAGTTGDRREKQLGQLDAAINLMEKKHEIDLTLVSGDINHRAENIAKQHSVSQGGREKNQRPKSGHLPSIAAPALGSIKHPQINQLMNRFNVIDPNLKSVPDAEYLSDLDRKLDPSLDCISDKKSDEKKTETLDDKDTATYAELKYTRGPFNYREVKIGGKVSPKHNWKDFQKQIYAKQSIYQGEEIPTYTGTAVVDACLQKEDKSHLADQGKLIDVTLVSSPKELATVKPSSNQEFKLFMPSKQYQQQSIIHSVKGKSDHHALFTKVTESHSTIGVQTLLPLAKTEPSPIALTDDEAAKLKEESSRPRSRLQRLGYR